MFFVRSEYSLKNFQGCCLLFNYQGSYLLSQATALIDYHISCRLSTTFLFFFVVFRVTSTLLRFASRDSYIRIPLQFIIVNNVFIISSIPNILIIILTISSSSDLHFLRQLLLFLLLYQLISTTLPGPRTP